MADHLKLSATRLSHGGWFTQKFFHLTLQREIFAGNLKTRLSPRKLLSLATDCSIGTTRSAINLYNSGAEPDLSAQAWMCDARGISDRYPNKFFGTFDIHFLSYIKLTIGALNLHDKKVTGQEYAHGVWYKNQNCSTIA